MPFQISPLPPEAITNPGTFSRQFEYHKGLRDEQGLVTQTIRRANNDQCRIQALFDENRCYGFAAMRLGEFNKKPAIVLEYLFASLDQRGTRHEDLGDLTVGEYLLQHCLEQARLMNTLIPIYHFILEPADPRLIRYYREKEFELVDKTGWMFISI